MSVQPPAAPHRVSIADVEIPFWRMVAIMIKWTLAAIPAVSTVVTVPAPAGVTPIASAPVPTDLDIDHGKGRDRDDTIHKHPGRGKALGLRK